MPVLSQYSELAIFAWWATLTSRAKNCHCERSEAIASFPLRLLRYARNDMSLIRKIRYQLAWDTTNFCVSAQKEGALADSQHKARFLTFVWNDKRCCRSDRREKSLAPGIIEFPQIVTAKLH